MKKNTFLLILICCLFGIWGCALPYGHYFPPKTQKYTYATRIIDLPFNQALNLMSDVLERPAASQVVGLFMRSTYVWQINNRGQRSAEMKKKIEHYTSVDCGTYVGLGGETFEVIDKDSLYEIKLSQISDSQTRIKIKFIGGGGRWVLSPETDAIISGKEEIDSKERCIPTGEFERDTLASLDSNDVRQKIAWLKANYTLQEKVELENLNIDLTEAQHWKENGFTAPDIAAWKKAGFRLSEAVDWRNAKFKTAEAHEWKNDSFDLLGAIKWKGAKFSPAEAREWQQASFDLPEAIKWRDAKFSLLDAKEWKDNGFSVDEAKNYRAKGYDPTLARWVKGGFNPDEAAKWIEHSFALTGNSLYETALVWKNAGFNYEEAMKWTEDGFSLEEAKKNKGIGLKEALRRREVAEERRETALWIKKGFSLKELAFWKEAKFNTEDAIKAKERGETLNEAIELKPCGYNESIADLVQTNPYDVKNKCFQFAGQRLQLLGRSTALFSVGQFIFYVDFAPGSVPMYCSSGVVKGIGTFSYVTAMGTENIIPKMKVLECNHP
jgi:hypothetical protein